ncbi:radical SAM protein [bacterium]
MKVFKQLKTIIELFIVFIKVILFRLGYAVTPYKICWLLTSKCNLRCCYCDISKPTNRKKNHEDMSFEEALNTASQFKKLGVKFIALSGGEPLVYKHIFPLIDFLKKQGFIVGINTNGILITDSVAKKLAESRIDIIMVSLDYPGELQDEIRGMNGCFEKIDKAFKHLLKYKAQGKYTIGVQAVISKLNYDKIEDIFVYAKKKGVDSVALQPTYIQPIFFGKTNTSTETLQVPKEKIAYLKTKLQEISDKYSGFIRNSSFFLDGITKYFINPKMPGSYCYGGGLTINISPEGYVGACHYMLEKKCGTLKERTLKEIIKSNEYKDFLNKIRNKQCPTCWCPVMHEYNIFFHPLDIIRSLKLIRTARTGE